MPNPTDLVNLSKLDDAIATAESGVHAKRRDLNELRNQMNHIEWSNCNAREVAVIARKLDVIEKAHEQASAYLLGLKAAKRELQS